MPSTPPTSAASIAAVRSLARASRVLERSSESLSLADYRMLSTIVEGEARASRLASRLALGKPAVSASVDSLCRRGLLLKTQVEGDQRASALSLTDEGRRVFAEAEATMVARIELLCSLTTDSAATMKSLAELGGAIETWVLQRQANA